MTICGGYNYSEVQKIKYKIKIKKEEEEKKQSRIDQGQWL
jgi:hypothetical protein